MRGCNVSKGIDLVDSVDGALNGTVGSGNIVLNARAYAIADTLDDVAQLGTIK